MDCQISVCESCALFGSHKGHGVHEHADLIGQLEKRMEVLMDSYQSLQMSCGELEANRPVNEAIEFIGNHKRLLMIKAREKVFEWKKMIDESLLRVSKDIDLYFKQYEDRIEAQRGAFNELW